ncbi:hypothetical protein NQZ68_029047, partial [Dissostichus eleginoides]
MEEQGISVYPPGQLEDRETYKMESASRSSCFLPGGGSAVNLSDFSQCRDSEREQWMDKLGSE